MEIQVVHWFATLMEKLHYLQQYHGDTSVLLMAILEFMFKSTNIMIGLKRVNTALY